jgi:predicted transcriptional regulator
MMSSQLETHIGILTLIRGGVDIPSRIIYSSNVAWKPLLQMLKLFIVQGLVEERSVIGGNERSYSIIRKGDNVLRYLNGTKILMELVSPVF